MKVLITEKIAEDGIIHLRDNGYETDVKFGLSKEELLGIIGDYDALIVRSATKVTKEVIEKGTKLKAVGRAGNGIDNIDVEACTKKGIIVLNTPDGNTMAAAELTVALILSLYRNIPQAYMAAKNKDFRRGKFVGVEFDGKTAGIIGLGRIGTIVAQKLKGCNMKIIAYDPFLTDEKLNKLGIERCNSIEELLKQSDIISVHIPKTPDSQNLIGEKELKLCKKGVRIVNVARGGIINEKALYNALKEGWVAGAAIDVFEKEPDFNKSPQDQDYENPLLELNNVIYTPHLGASTEEANYNVGVDIAKLISNALKGEMVPAVNMTGIKVNNLAELKPYLNLAEMLGKIYYQVEKETVQKLEIVYSGDLAEKETGIISLSVLKGFLEPVVNEKVNYVNARVALKGMGVEFTESKSTNLEKYTNLITVKFITRDREISVSGTIFAKQEIRVVDFFGYKLDFEPSPHVIAIQNIDKPGIIGQIGTILGAADINIAAMQWSRNRKGEKAVSFVSIDCEIANEVLERIKNIDGVLKASRLNF
ncbi:MAG: phosphoglycerate dehydrogenase [Clostridiaceae bacterium]|nr:phosphoglycerate dehydrogenase [Clostridiaceae bacterium]